MWYRTLGGIVTLTLGLLLAPLAAAAPPPARMDRIGWLGVGIPAAPASRPSLPHFLEGLRELGYGGTQSHHGVPLGRGEARTPARLTAMLYRGLLPPCLIHCAEDAQHVPRAREPERGGWLIRPGTDSPCTSAVLLPSLWRARRRHGWLLAWAGTQYEAPL
jgi:hypothetical protein